LVLNLFARLAEINRTREEDTTDEANVLRAMQAVGTPTGTLSDLKARLPTMSQRTLQDCIRNLVIRRKIDLLPGNRWKLLR
jgi:hypothetical protein